MMEVIRYETDIHNYPFPIIRKPVIFLAGPTVRGHQPHLTSWRFEAIEIFESKKFDGILIVPEFTSRTESDKYRYDIPVWEYCGLCKCDIIMFWIPRTKELIGLTTNHEMGYWMARERSKVVYGRPDNSYRNTYLDIMWVEDSKRKTDHDCLILNTLEKTIDETLRKSSLIYSLFESLN